MYDPSTNETYLDMSDPAKIEQILRENQKARKNFARGTYLTDIQDHDISEALNEAEEEAAADPESKQGSLVPLEQFDSGELGIKLSNLKFLIKKIHDVIHRKKQLASKSTQTQASRLPGILGKNATATLSKQDLMHMTVTGASQPKNASIAFTRQNRDFSLRRTAGELDFAPRANNHTSKHYFLRK